MSHQNHSSGAIWWGKPDLPTNQNDLPICMIEEIDRLRKEENVEIDNIEIFRYCELRWIFGIRYSEKESKGNWRKKLYFVYEGRFKKDDSIQIFRHDHKQWELYLNGKFDMTENQALRIYHHVASFICF